MQDHERWHDEHGHVDKRLLHLRGLLSDANLNDPDDSGHVLGGAPLRRARGFRAEGLLEGRYYSVGVFWGGELGEQVTIRGWPDSRDHVLAVFRAHEGEQVPVDDTGRAVVLHMNHPLAIRAALSAYGEVRTVWGDEPSRSFGSGGADGPLLDLP